MRIGFIALSGLRVYDAELASLGLTLPGFIERGKAIAALPSLGLLTLAGLTPLEHECEYFEVSDLQNARSIPDRFDLVAISSLSAQIDEAYQLADSFRQRKIPVVMGGLHVTSMSDEAALHCDAVVVGEGEPVWRNVVDDASRGRLKSQYRPSAEHELARSPLPRYELLNPDKYNRLTVQTSRGCPLQCEFCASSILLTQRYKQKPIDCVLNEIDHIREIWRRPFIEFADDNSFVNRRYWKELLPELTARNIRWFAECDLSIHRDDELLSRMRDSGCAQVLIGFESPVQNGLAGIELKNDWKRKKWPEYRQAIETIQSHGIRVNGCFILGLDGHRTDIFDHVYDFAIESELFDVQVTVLTPFPGTPLYRRLKRDGRLLFDGDWRRYTLFDVNYRPTHMTPTELRGGLVELVARLYSEELTRWRRENFNQKYLRASNVAEAG